MKRYGTSLIMCMSIFALLMTSAISLARGEKKLPKDMTKQQYIDQVETRVNEWESKVVNLKTDRDKLDTATERYKVLNEAVSDIEGSLAEIRGEMRQLRTSGANANWADLKNDINSQFAAIQRAEDKTKVAE